jgi:hypothetical protein
MPALAGGFHTIIACRSTQHGAQTAREIRAEVVGSGELQVMALDLTDFESVHRFAEYDMPTDHAAMPAPSCASGASPWFCMPPVRAPTP